MLELLVRRMCRVAVTLRCHGDDDDDGGVVIMMMK